METVRWGKSKSEAKLRWTCAVACFSFAFAEKFGAQNFQFAVSVHQSG
jgi:hypothetical protein